MLANIRHVGNFAAGFSTDSDNAPWLSMYLPQPQCDNVGIWLVWYCGLCLKICLSVLLLLILLDFWKTSDAEMLMKYLKQTK